MAGLARDYQAPPLLYSLILRGTVGGVIGSTIDGRYRIRRLLGRGGMGVVYAADHIGLDRMIALKVIEHAKASADLVTRFRREARAASRIVHPNVVQIFDVGTSDGIDYIAMEYVEGRDLGKILREDGRLEPARAITVTRQLLAGLHAIHEGGIVHRDIKPANVILSGSGDDEIVKIMDFGIAKSMDSSVAITAPGHAIGTANYMAPEQVLGGDIDHRADLYSAGITLYAMLAGEEPFTGATFVRVARKQLSDRIPPLDEVRPDLPRPLVAAVARAVEKAPADRFEDARAFSEALEREVPRPARAAARDPRDITTTVPQRGSRPQRDEQTATADEQSTSESEQSANAAKRSTGADGVPTARARTPQHDVATASARVPAARRTPMIGAVVGVVAIAALLLIALALGREQASKPPRDATMQTADRGAAGDASIAPVSARDASLPVVPAPTDAAAPIVDAAERPRTDAAALFDAARTTTAARVFDAPAATTAINATNLDAPPTDTAADDAPSLPIDARTPPPRQPRAPLGTLREGPVLRCACVAEGRSTCKQVGPLLCKCAASEGELCSVPFTKCTPPDCDNYRICPDPGYGGFKYAAKPDSECAGYVRASAADRSERLFKGTYQCSYCSNLLRYDGAPGDPCDGFELDTGRPVKGNLNCFD